MLKINLKLDKSTDHPRTADRLLTLPFGERSKSRQRAVLDNGTVLRHGDLLLSDDGRVVEVRAAAECVSTVHTEDPFTLARACYHLGNRHVALQIGGGWLRYQHDHVLDDMLRGFGLGVTIELAPFEPEGGAYVSSHAAHAHPHEHSHG